MNSMLIKWAAFVAFIFAFLGTANAQVDPSRDIKWPSCTAGQNYEPNTNTCVTELVLKCADTSSSATTYTCATTPTLFSLVAGDTFVLINVNQNNSGSATLNIDTLGAVTIKKWLNSSNLAAGDLQTGASVLLTYDGTNLEASTIGNAPTGGGSPTGSAGGDLTGTYPNPGVGQVNGAAVPTSAAVVSTNSFKQLVASSAHSVGSVFQCADTSGSGTAQNCTTSPTFTPASLDCITYSTTTANTGSGLTVNVDSLGAKSVAVSGTSGWTTTLAVGGIPANKTIHMCYDGTNWNAYATGFAASGSGGSPPNVMYASAGNTSVSGCTLNTNLLTGGGTDATICLQAQLDWLGSNGGGLFILNGPALISNASQNTTNATDGNVQTTCLQTHSNIDILVPDGAGVFLAASSNCTLLGNNITGNPSATFQTNMKVYGGFWNGNNTNQSKYERANSSNGWNSGFWFGGFTNLEIRGVTLYDVATFNFVLSNGSQATLANDTEVENSTVPGLSFNQDGIHLDGTLSNITISNFIDNGGDDDPIAFNTDEGVVSHTAATDWHYARYSWSGGAINNVVVEGLTEIGTGDAYRFIGYTTSGGVATITNVVLRNFSGTTNSGTVPSSGLSACTNVWVENWTLTHSGATLDPQLYSSSCVVTPGVQGYGTIAQSLGTTGGGAWTWLAPSTTAGNGIGWYLGRALGSGYNAGGLLFVPQGSSASYWQFSFQGGSKNFNIYGTGDVSETGSDCGYALCLPASAGIQLATGGSSTHYYATDGSTPAVPTVPTVITSLQLVMPTSAIGANACSSETDVTMTGLVAPSGGTPGSVFKWAFEGKPDGVTGWGSTGGLVLNLWVHAVNSLGWDVCNQTAGSITGGAINIDVGASQ